MVRRVVSGFGRTSITLGILTLLFVAYQLWGTGIYTANAQSDLRTEFEHRLSQDPATITPTTLAPATTTTVAGPPTTTRPGATTTSSTTTTTAPRGLPPPADGDPAGTITIPKIGVDKAVVQGVGLEDLRQGPGHYSDTPMPGERGNAAIAGHRTTYGAPFGDLDKLENGDLIKVTTLQGTFNYRVFETTVVDPNDTSVLAVDPLRPAILTLTTCHPKFSAAQRLVVQAELERDVVPIVPTPVSTSGNSISAPKPKLSLSGESLPKGPAYLWGAIALVVGLIWWFVFHRHPRWTSWFLGMLPFAVVLFVFFQHLERVLPSNY